MVWVIPVNAVMALGTGCTGVTKAAKVVWRGRIALHFQRREFNNFMRVGVETRGFKVDNHEVLRHTGPLGFPGWETLLERIIPIRTVTPTGKDVHHGDSREDHYHC